MNTPESLSTVEVCRVSGASYRMLTYWANSGLIVPSIAEAQGSSLVQRRRYSLDDAVLCRLVVVLNDAGIRTETLRGKGVGSMVREAFSYGPGWYLLLTDGREPVVTVEPCDAIEGLSGSVVTLVCLDTIRRHVTTALRPAVASTPSANRPDPARANPAGGVDGAAEPSLTTTTEERPGAVNAEPLTTAR